MSNNYDVRIQCWNTIEYNARITIMSNNYNIRLQCLNVRK